MNISKKEPFENGLNVGGLKERGKTISVTYIYLHYQTEERRVVFFFGGLAVERNYLFIGYKGGFCLFEMEKNREREESE